MLRPVRMARSCSPLLKLLPFCSLCCCIGSCFLISLLSLHQKFFLVIPVNQTLLQLVSL